MNPLVAPTSGSALGALGLIGAPAASAASADATAAQDFAALFGAALHQAAQPPMAPPSQRAALAALADATWGDDPLATSELPTDGSADVTALLDAFDGAESAPAAPGATIDAHAAARLAAAAAAAAAPAPAVAPVAPKAAPAVARATDELDPVFASRLGRVLERMREAGHDVTIAETVRTGARQDALYAQGRTAPGPVVTWTRESRHEQGAAADLVVDGAYDGAGYRTLQRIAAEEGLRTLGARDPGHVELPRTTADAKEGAAARRGAGVLRFLGDLAAAVHPGRGIAAAAPVAQVARVATVANVARVAQVAVPGLTTGRAGAAARGTSTPAATTLPSAQAVAHAAPHSAAVRRAAAAAEAAVPAIAGLVDARLETAALRGGRPGTTTSAATGHAKVRGTGDATVPTGDAAPVLLDGTGREGEARGVAATGDDAAEARGRGDGAADARDARRGLADAAPRITDPADARAARAERLRRQVTRAVNAIDETLDRGATALRRDSAHDATMGLGDAMRATASRGPGAPAAVTPAGSLAAERVAALLAARDAAPAPTIGELRLAMDPARDGLSEVRLAMDGAALDATLRATDPALARGLQGEIASLAKTLERQGFETARVQVTMEAAQQQRAAAMDTVNATSATAADRGLRDGATGRDARDPQQTHDSHREQQHQQRFGGRRGRDS